jgi:outer membrane protein assembly factor BamB
MTIQRLRIELSLPLTVLLLTLGIIFAQTTAASTSPTLLGGINLDKYCTSLTQGSATLSGTVWNCTGNNQPINMNAACIWQYASSSAFASQTRSNDPYSYQCFSNAQTTPPPTNLGGMNLDQYCTSIAEGPYSYLNGQTWSCTGNGHAIDLNAACVWQYNIANAYAAEATPGDVYSYSCYSQGSSTSPPPNAATDDWTTYKYGASRSSYNNLESVINVTTAANLKQVLAIAPTTPAAVISDQPAVVNNVVYYGDWLGNFYARDTKGAVLWTKNLGVMMPPAGNGCTPSSIGVVSSPSVKTITVNGVATPIVYVTGADGYMYALYASNGTVLWKTQLTDPSTGGLLWDSPAEYNGSVFVGVASYGDCPLVQGKEFKLNWRTGAIQAVAKLVPDGCVGAGEWGSPTIDETNNKIYLSTGTQDNSCKLNGQPYVEPNALAIVELDMNLAVVGSWRIPPTEQGIDSDFGISPTLSTATINGVSTQLVSGGNKNGRYYVFKRDALSAGPIVDKVLGQGGTCPDCGEGTISSSATDGKTLYQGTGSTTVGGVNYKSSVVALNPANGAVIWQHGLAHALVASPTLIKGVLLVPEGNHLDLINTSNGNEILQLTPSGAASVFDAPAAVARGMVFLGNLNGSFFEFGL